MTTTTEQPTYIVIQQAPPPRKGRVPKWLWLIVAAVLVAGGGYGTFASFSASTSNTGTFATGSIVLSNSVNSGTACLSAVGNVTDTNTNNCSALFSLSTKKPGDSATANLDLQNAGTINASALQAYVGSACAASNAGGETYHGTGDPCGKVNLTILEYPTALDRTNNTNPGTCYYGGASCAFDNTKTLSAFGTSYPDTTTTLGMGALNASSTRYFKIGVQFDSSAGNNMQGRAATISITWRIIQ